MHLPLPKFLPCNIWYIVGCNIKYFLSADVKTLDLNLKIVSEYLRNSNILLLGFFV